MTRTKPPAFQFYAADFLMGTRMMSAAAVGTYMRMLCTSWEQGPIQNTPRAIQRAMGLGPGDPSFDDLWPEIQDKWIVTVKGLINPRLEGVRAEQSAFTRKQRANGRQGGRPPRNPNETQTKPKTNPDVNPNESQEETQTKANANPNTNPNETSPYSDLRTPISDLRTPGIGVLSERGGTARAREPIVVYLPTSPRPILLDADIGPPIEHPTEPPDTGDPDGIEPRFAPPKAARFDSLVEDHRKCHPAAFQACARSWCVPRFLVSQWLQQLAAGGRSAPEAEVYVRAVIARLCASQVAGALGDEPLKFWRAVWQAEHGSQAPVSEATNTREARMLAAAERTRAWLRAGGLGRPS